MSKTLKRYWERSGLILLAVGLMGGGILLQDAKAFVPNDDLMNTKGYSPEVIFFTQRQRVRQEWKERPAPVMTPKEKFFHNIYNNQWTGSFDEFGEQILKEN
jgi:hypothetical protein